MPLAPTAQVTHLVGLARPYLAPIASDSRSQKCICARRKHVRATRLAPPLFKFKSHFAAARQAPQEDVALLGTIRRVIMTIMIL